MTPLLTSIGGATVAEMQAQVERAIASGTEGFELRLDHLEPRVEPSAVAEVLARMRPGSWVVTLRSVEEGGRCAAPAEARLGFLLAATAGQAGCLDFEYRAWPAGLGGRAWAVAGAGHRWILSFHDFREQPADVPALARAVVAAGPEVVAKVAWAGHSLSDNIVAFEIMRELGERVIAVVMGEVGLASRVLAKKFGAAATYCALSAEAETAPGQVALDDMLHKYRWNAITPATHLFGVLGHPVRHSMSPALFNRMFERGGMDAVYLPLLVAGEESELVAFLEHCERRPWLDVGGFSVTLPHKQAARRFVGSRIEPLAARLGAVNTLAMRDGRFYGYNTDYAGALDALCHGLTCARTELRGLCVDVLGAGGGARAVVAGLTDCGCAVTVFNRTPDSAAALAAEFGCRSAPWDDRVRRTGHVVINCTSVGMTPDTEGSPLPAEALQDRPVVFDTVYHPVETRLLREAQQVGCLTIDGVEMFVRQAAAQYQIWFGGTADVAEMRQIVLRELRGNVVLIGYRGSGKTTVGRLLADRLEYAFVDTDALVVERAGKAIAAIFAEDGEVAFRRREADVIAEASRRSRVVLSAGGGAVLGEANVRRLRDCGTVFWLGADAETLWSRISRDAASAAGRPALTQRADLDEVRHVLGERETLYQGCAHHRVDVADRTPAEVVEVIEAILRRVGQPVERVSMIAAKWPGE